MQKIIEHNCKVAFLMAVVATQQPAHNENEHASWEVKLELKGHNAWVLIINKKLLN